MTVLPSERALVLLVNLVKRLFGHKIPALKQTPVMRRFEKDLFAALERLERNPGASLDDLPLGVQRLVYEMITQYITLYALAPKRMLSLTATSCKTEDQELSALIRQEIMQHSWPYPQSVPL